MRFSAFGLPAAVCVFLSVVIAAVAGAVETDKVPAHLQNVAVTVLAGDASGSGTIVMRKIDGVDRAFVWTAHHVIDNLRSVKTEIVDGKDVKRVTYDDTRLHVVQQRLEDGTTVGETKLSCKVIACSPKNDVAVLIVRAKGIYTEGIEFDLSGAVTPVATALYHCGSPAGQELGHNSLTEGIIAANGRMFDGLPYDQTTCSAVGGSSGGVVARKSDGAYLGMLTLGLNGTSTFNYIVPARRIVSWAKKQNIEYLVNPATKALTSDELGKVPTEDGDVRGVEAARTQSMQIILMEPTPAVRSILGM